MKIGVPVWYESVGSTQDVARELWDQGAAPGTVVSARAMTAGRGRRGRIWHVPPGANVCLTVILPLPIESVRLWELSLVVGLATAEGIAAIAPDAQPVIRFPNDVYVQGRKLSGILIETTGRWTEPGKGIVALVGIGVNVLAAPFPPEIADRAISLEAATGTAHLVEAVEERILRHLEGRVNQWLADDLFPILRDWRTWLNRDLERSFILDGVPLLCRVTDIQSDGVLTLLLPDGTCRSLPAVRVIYGDD